MPVPLINPEAYPLIVGVCEDSIRSHNKELSIALKAIETLGIYGSSELDNPTIEVVCEALEAYAASKEEAVDNLEDAVNKLMGGISE